MLGERFNLHSPQESKVPKDGVLGVSAFGIALDVLGSPLCFEPPYSQLSSAGLPQTCERVLAGALRAVLLLIR